MGPGSGAAKLAWRPLTVDDAPGLLRLLADVEAVDDTGRHYGADELREELTDPAVDLAVDSLGGFAGADVVAFATVYGQRTIRDVDRLYLDGTVHPRLRGGGLGAELVAWQARRALARHRATAPGLPGEVHAHVHVPNAAARALYEAAGFPRVRWFFDMRRDLTDGPVPASEPGGGLRVVPFEDRYDEPVRLAHVEAFADHWAHTPADEVAWRQHYTSSQAFRPVLSFVALAGAALASAEVAGYLLGYQYPADEAANGYRDVWVGHIGTRREWRRRGVAGALLSRLLVAARADGCAVAMLDVDGANPTGALGVYRRHGFVTDRTYVRYVLPIPAAGPDPA